MNDIVFHTADLTLCCSRREFGNVLPHRMHVQCICATCVYVCVCVCVFAHTYTCMHTLITACMADVDIYVHVCSSYVCVCVCVVCMNSTHKYVRAWPM